MKPSQESLRPVINRIRRAQGQLLGVIKMLEEGQDCEKVITQLAAASKALDKAGFQLVSVTLQECISADGSGQVDIKRLEKVFLSLS